MTARPSFSYSIVEKITRLFAQDGTWRLIDAYTPRVYGLFLNSFLIAEFGAKLYALPGWILGSFGLILAFIPDPHSYILVRANGPRAQALYALTVPSLLFKSLFAALLVMIGLSIATSGNITAPHGKDWNAVALAALFYGSTELLWAALGTISLANGNVRQTAQIGIIARIASIALLWVAWKYSGFGIAGGLVLATLPVFIGWCVLSPFSLRWRRIWFFFLHGLYRYAGWMQGISLVTVGLFQMPIIALGAWPSVDPALLGIVAFTNRLLMAGFQPFQILQSVVIRDASRMKHGGLLVNRTPLWIVFKLGGVVFFALALIGLGVAWESGTIGLDSLVLTASLSLGITISIWYRHELAVSLAVKNIRQILLVGYIPSFSLTILAAPLLMQFYGVYGLAFAIAFGWIALSNSWRWVK
jgi:hypothetical protein